MMILSLVVAILCVVSASHSPADGADSVRHLESRETTSVNCGNWATGSRSSAQRLQQQLLACDDNQWGQSFTVQGTKDVKAGDPSPCIGLACDYVSAKDFHHTQLQLCNDGPHAVTMNCTEVAYWAQRLIDECCTDPSSDGLSGQYFLGDGTNIDVSYSDACSTSERPSDPGPGMSSCVSGT